jgi:hypothetical protein
MVPYAGFDPTEEIRIHWRHARAAKLFACGFDTLSIAMDLKTTEDRALKYVSIGRSHFLGLPSPYEGERQ